MESSLSNSSIKGHLNQNVLKITLWDFFGKHLTLQFCYREQFKLRRQLELPQVVSYCNWPVDETILLWCILINRFHWSKWIARFWLVRMTCLAFINAVNEEALGFKTVQHVSGLFTFSFLIYWLEIITRKSNHQWEPYFQ